VEVRVRPAVIDDAPAIAQLHVRAWQAAYRGLVPDALLDGLSVRARETRWRELLAGAPRTLVAIVAGEVAGFCSTVAPARDEDLPPRTAEIAAIYVDPDRWRSGAGQALLDAALDGLRDEGHEAVVLWVLAGNERALRFYEACGLLADGATKLEPLGSVEQVEGLPQVRLRRAL
jgi:ribosomal protein S18 acetylase RimI-like enzyme